MAETMKDAIRAEFRDLLRDYGAEEVFEGDPEGEIEARAEDLERRLRTIRISDAAPEHDRVKAATLAGFSSIVGQSILLLDASGAAVAQLSVFGTGAPREIGEEVVDHINRGRLARIAAEIEDPRKWVLVRNGAFSRPGLAGYTNSLAEAGKWTREEAKAIEAGGAFSARHVDNCRRSR